MTKNETQVRAIIDARIKAIRDKDRSAAIESSADDVVVYNALPPLQFIGIETEREQVTGWMGAYEGPIGYEIRDLRIVADTAAAFSHFLYRVSGTLTDGLSVDMWVRATLGFRKFDDVWRVVHEHHSVPFDPATGEALTELAP